MPAPRVRRFPTVRGTLGPGSGVRVMLGHEGGGSSSAPGIRSRETGFRVTAVTPQRQGSHSTDFSRSCSWGWAGSAGEGPGREARASPGPGNFRRELWQRQTPLCPRVVTAQATAQLQVPPHAHAHTNRAACHLRGACSLWAPRSRRQARDTPQSERQASGASRRLVPGGHTPDTHRQGQLTLRKTGGPQQGSRGDQGPGSMRLWSLLKPGTLSRECGFHPGWRRGSQGRAGPWEAPQPLCRVPQLGRSHQATPEWEPGLQRQVPAASAVPTPVGC